MTGYGSTASANGWDIGVWLDGYTTVEATGAGNVAVTGYGGGTGAGSNNFGVATSNYNGGATGDVITSKTGNITITGIDGSGSGGSNYGIDTTDGTPEPLTVGTTSGPATSGNINFITNDWSINTSAFSVNTTGNYFITTYSTGSSNTIGLAGSSPTGNLAISNAILTDMNLGNAHSLTVGATGDAGLLTAQAFTPGTALSLISGSGGIIVSGVQTMAHNNLTLETDGALTISSNLVSTGTGLLTIEPATASNGINVDAAASAGNIGLTSTDLGHIVSHGWANFTMGRSDETGTITVPAFTFATTGVTTVQTGSSGSIALTGSPTGTGTTSFVFNGPTTLSADATVTTANQGVTFSSTVDGGHNLTVAAGNGTVTYTGAVGGSTALSSLSDSGSGTTVLDASVTTSGTQSYTGPVTLGGNDTLTTANSNVTFSSTVDATSSGGQSLTVSDGSGTLDFAGKAGNTHPLNNLTITSDNLIFGNNVFGTGTLTIQPSTASQPIHIADGTSSGLYITGTEQGYLQNDWAGIVIGSTSNTGTLTVGTTTWSNPLTLQTGSGTIEFAGAQTLGGHSLTADSSSGNIQLDSGATITSTATSGYPIVLAASGGNFVNNSGSSSPLSTGAGASWAVYSTAPANDTNGASVMNPATTVYATTYPTTTGESGTTWFYGSSLDNLGTITITAENQSVTYGTAPNTSPVLNTTYTCSGSGGACSDISGLPGLSISGSVTTSSSGNYKAGTWTNDILAALGSLGFNSGYTGSFSLVDGTLTVLAKALSITGVTANNKTYDATTAATLNTGSAALSGKVAEIP